MRARAESIELANYYLGTEHLSLAMLLEPNHRLRPLLEAHGVDAGDFLDSLYEAVPPGGAAPEATQTIVLTPRIRQAVRHADELCQAGDGGLIAEVHLLAGLLASGRGVFVRVLECFRVSPEELLEDLSSELEREQPEPELSVEALVPSRFQRTAVSSRRQPEAEPDFAHAPPQPSTVDVQPSTVDVARNFPKIALGGNNPALLDWGILRQPTTGGEKKSRQGKAEVGSLLDLDRLGRDLTALAKEDVLATVIGREADIEQLQRALCRANRNNPLLVGEAGVGKTAIVEGLARRIAQGNVPSVLRALRIVEIPIAALTAETRFRGDLEERMLALVDEIRRDKVVLLIDDVECLAAGNASGTPELGRLLRPILSRGDIHVIGTTTPSAYSRHIERDAGLLRCFHPIKIAPPDDATVLDILRSVRKHFEAFHGVQIHDTTLDAVIRLAHGFLKQKNMPDAAVDLLDEACVKAASDSPRGISEERPGAFRPGDGCEDVVTVRPQDVCSVVAQRTGIPVEELTVEERARLARMEEEMRRQVIGQDDAVRRVCERIRMFKTGLHEESRPLGVFLFLGPTGVGKTELARAIARFLFNSEEHLYRLDMSEYAEQHEVARLIGPPPGYVGYGEDGLLSGAVRRDPHCVVLLDEIDKAHPKVYDLFLQVFDEGRLTDGRGTTTDFTRAIIVLTANLGADLWKADQQMGFRQSRTLEGCLHDGDEAPSARIFETLKKTFRLEFLNRLDDVILFRPLGPDDIRAIARLMVARWQARSAEQGHPFEVDDEVLDFLCGRGYDSELGARPMKRAIEQYLIAPLSRHVLNQDFASQERVRARVRGGGGNIVFEPEGLTGTGGS